MTPWMWIYIASRRVKKATRYFPSHQIIYNNSGTNKEEERRKKDLCFICEKDGHLKFSCPNKKPKNLKMINKMMRPPLLLLLSPLPRSEVY